MSVETGEIHQMLVETLLVLHRTGRSCVIRFEHGSAKKQIVLSRGSLAFAESNQPDEHLAHVLIKLNLLSSRDLKQVSALMKSGKSSEEAVVLATGLGAEQLQAGVREQAVAILASLFGWPAFEHHIFDGDGLIRRGCNLALPLPLALAEAARRAVKVQSIPAAFHAPAGLICADTATGARESIPLNSAEAYAYAQVQNPIPVAQLLPVLPAGEAKPLELVQRLLLLGFFRLEAAVLGPHISADNLPMAQLSEQIDELLRRFEVANLYEILSVPSDIDEDGIKNAYHEMAKLYHPDRFQSREYSAEFRSRAGKLFTYITGAYTTLGDPATRAHYDDTRMKKESVVEATLQGRAAVDADRDKIAETIYRAGRIAIRNKEFEKAVSQLKESVWLRPDTARYRHSLGVAQAEIPALRKEAEKHLLKAIALEPTRADSHLELGKLYLKVNLPKKARAQIEEALRWDFENPEAQRILKTLEEKSHR